MSGVDGAGALFPARRLDFHGKLNEALSKCFGRLKIGLGYTSKKKVFYSLPHSMKDFLEEAQMPSKHLPRIMRHAYVQAMARIVNRPIYKRQGQVNK